MQKFDHTPKKTLITGGSGTGKTTLAEKLMRAEKSRLKFVYDHDGQFAHRFDHESAESVDALEEAVARGGWVVYDPVNDFQDNFSLGLEFFADYVLTVSKNLRGRKLFYCDEIDLLTTTNTYPRTIVALMQTGRRYEIDCVLIAGQPNKLHNCIRTQMTDVYTFLHTDEAALKFLTDNSIQEDTIRSLGQHGWFYRNLRTGETRSNLRSKKSIDSETTKDAGPIQK